MGSNLRYPLTLLAWVAALALALLAVTWTFSRPELGVTRVLAVILVMGMLGGLFRHVDRTNVTLARFVEALHHGDFSTRVGRGGTAGAAKLGSALDGAMQRLQAERAQGAEELRFISTLVDDMPVALLTIEQDGPIRLANKAARRLFGATETLSDDDIARFGSSFAARLAGGARATREIMILRLAGGPQRVLLRAGTLERLGTPVRVFTVEPIQSTLDAVEVAAQTDLVRVLTHEILNSLTPVTSIAESAAAMLQSDRPDLPEVRAAVTTMARRASGLQHFVSSYRAVASPPQLRKKRFAAGPFAAELAALFRADWPAHQLHVVAADELTIDADPDLLAQALINLMRNAAQASGDEGKVFLRVLETGVGKVSIEVEDDGPGIPEELLKDIFLPFFTTRAEGTGVGLNLVRQILVAHGWQIDVSSGEHGGALFRISAS